MTTLTENVHANEFRVSEANGDRSREAVTVKSGQNLKSGAVLGTLVSATAVSAAKSGGNTGNGTCVPDATNPALLGIKPGVYKLRFLTTTSIRLEDPDGVVLGDTAITATTGQTATIAEQIKAVITEGGTTFAAGDGFDITITAIVEKEVEYNPAGTDGSEIATGVLYRAVDASAADTKGVAYKRDCELNAAMVTWKTGATATQKAKGTADLKRAGIVLR